MGLLRVLLMVAVLVLTLTAGKVGAQTPLDEDSPWPRVRSTNGNTVTLYQPQVESWTSNSFSARAAVEVKRAGVKKESLGVVWFDAHGTVDRSNRVVTLDRMELTKGRFPESADKGSNELAIVRDILPSGARTVSFDYLVTALGFAQAAARKGPAGLKHTPPQIIWSTNRAVLVRIDGEPVMRPIPGVDLERVINTPALLVHDQAGSKFYLEGDGRWFAASSIQGPWSLAQTPPANVTALSPPSTNAPTASSQEAPPRIIVSTSPAELLMTSGLPDFRPIRGTALQYAADTDSQLFLYEGEAYLLLSGRWFKAKSLQGPWTQVAPHDLPAEFAKIPPGSPQAAMLACVPGTPQAELAVIANSVPVTATVNRRSAQIALSYDGEPKFKPIEGTTMTYAINAQLPVIHCGASYYANDNGVWFVAASPTGPWEVAAEVPEDIYTIPPGSPVYYATYARVYSATEEEVEAGYTAGYQGTYEYDDTVVYGTGWDYEPYYGDDSYYGWGWSWGYSYWYVPWYGWWVWRPWWSPPGGLRAALIENLYDRWQGRPGVVHHDRPNSLTAKPGARTDAMGFPALYGRFKGSTRPAAMVPPANTVVLNAYARPRSAVQAGEMPKGAQLLSTVLQSPSRGRDLYASPDGSVYLRKKDGWYSQSGGTWKFYSPLQGTMAREEVAAARGARPDGAGAVYRPTATERNSGTARDQARADRVPDAGTEVRQQQVEALEREYYARSIAQARAQNARAANVSRPTRGGGRR